ncbi:cytochrome c oxidase subunit 3 family protein [Litoribacillus peritrichatus]|uniref:Cytochrome c oxidase subunit 3 n=1 Tax=Litoribacillus peritrichatus TaxID=718191 RepID=A0ABP7MKA5_9GAMM
MSTVIESGSHSTFPAAQSVSSEKELPGDLAVWFFILAELTVFAIFFIAYSWMHTQNSEMFSAGQATLHPIAGLINTVSLITSSYVVALAMIAAREGNRKRCQQGLMLAVLIAGVYVVSKLWEYNLLIEAGYDLSTNTFYMFYFFMTGFHFMHVLLGMVVLVIFVFCLQNESYLNENFASVEAGACYWHMVDLLWIILFPLIYVI